MTDNAWVQALKPGDEVFYRYWNYGWGPYSLEAVEKVTPTGRIVLRNGLTFNPDGRERTSNRHSHMLEQATPELREKVVHDQRKRLLVGNLAGVTWSSLPLETLERITELVESAKPAVHRK